MDRRGDYLRRHRSKFVMGGSNNLFSGIFLRTATTVHRAAAELGQLSARAAPRDATRVGSCLVRRAHVDVGE